VNCLEEETAGGHLTLQGPFVLNYYLDFQLLLMKKLTDSLKSYMNRKRNVSDY